MTSFFSCTDLFAGAGGSSTGLEAAGIEVVIAANHNEIALQTHAANHPNTRHDLCDLMVRNPAHYPRTTMLWASPACTSHSAAAGKKRVGIGQMDLWGDIEEEIDPDGMRSRALMNDVLRFVDYHRYEIIVIENVSEVRSWTHYDKWLAALQNMGYATKEVFLNSQHVGVPQSRDRIYICAWRKGNKAPDLELRPLAYCDKCDCDVPAVWMKKNPNKPLPGKVQWSKQYIYVCPKGHGEVTPKTTPAASVMDWWRKATKIADRKKPLSDNTMRRIQKGLNKYGSQEFILAHYSSPVYTGTNEPLSTIPTVNKHMLVSPFLIDTAHSTEVSDNGHMRSIDGVLPTITTAQSLGVVMPEPFIVSMYGRDSAHSPIGSPLPAITTINNQHSVVVPPAFMAAYHGGSDVYNGAHEPLSTVTTTAIHGLIQFDPTNVNIQDCYYRMVHYEELKRGMSFPTDYHLCGTSDAVKTLQIGNSVTPDAAEFLGQRMFASLS